MTRRSWGDSVYWGQRRIIIHSLRPIPNIGIMVSEFYHWSRGCQVRRTAIALHGVHTLIGGRSAIRCGSATLICHMGRKTSLLRSFSRMSTLRRIPRLVGHLEKEVLPGEPSCHESNYHVRNRNRQLQFNRPFACFVRVLETQLFQCTVVLTWAARSFHRPPCS
jgi:hypothetical protein